MLVILEGRDGAGKDGTIKRLTEHMSPRDTRVHAPGKPSDREEIAMVFPALRAATCRAADEFVIFNRSWYNRAGVERVMGFCSRGAGRSRSSKIVVRFEQMLVRDGIDLRKYYLDISKKEQKKRLRTRARRSAEAVEDLAGRRGGDEEVGRLFARRATRCSGAPAIRRALARRRANDKKIARLEFLRDLLAGFDYSGKDEDPPPDRNIVFEWSEKKRKLLAP